MASLQRAKRGVTTGLSESTLGKHPKNGNGFKQTPARERAALLRTATRRKPANTHKEASAYTHRGPIHTMSYSALKSKESLRVDFKTIPRESSLIENVTL